MRIATWNLEWHKTKSSKGNLAKQKLLSVGFDVGVITETNVEDDLEYETVDAGPDWGYQSTKDRRKVMMLSREPWSSVVAPTERPLLGRYISATTLTSIGPVRVVGVCIPWFDCHVSHGARDRNRWEEFVGFVEESEPFLRADFAHGLPVVLAGDFNVAIPRKQHTNATAYADLLSLMQRLSLDVATANLRVPNFSKSLLDHIAVSNLTVDNVQPWSNVIDDLSVSDHAGVYVDLSA